MQKSLNNITLKHHLANLLCVNQFKDYCPNGLQIQGKQTIHTIITGVSANLALIEAAIEQKADAIIVHHGFFWKNEHPEIIGAKRKKIALLLEHNINLYAYHLPLDAHLTLGNNIQLAHKLGIKNPKPLANSLVWQGELPTVKTKDFTQTIADKLHRTPLITGVSKQNLNSIAWCTGGAQNAIDEAIELGVDVYLSGEISEQTPYTALENNITYISAGHHATERYGVQALGHHLVQQFGKQFGISHQFIEIDNQV